MFELSYPRPRASQFLLNFSFVALALSTGLTACTLAPVAPMGDLFQRAPGSGYAENATGDTDDAPNSPRADQTFRHPGDRSPASLQPLPAKPQDVDNIINAGDIAIGMSRKEVRESWGRPVLVEVAGSATNGNERWTYQEDVPSQSGYLTQRKVILFRTDRVVGWKTQTNDP